MMEWGHFEDAFLAQLIRANLQNDGKRFNDKHTADERQQEFLLDHDGHGADCPAERQRPNIAHENFGWMGVVPKKPDRASDHGSAKDGQFANLRHTLEFEVGGKCRVAAYVGKNSERTRGNHGAADGEAVEAVGQVYSIART